ncbi:MAG: ATP-dependent sacrificial sulfur transferase LarE [Thermodesulfovibrionales bacterium]
MSSSTDDLPGKKFSRLLDLLRSSGSAVLAYSGGVDSSFLLKALQVSGVRYLAVTAQSPALPAQDLRDALAFCRETGSPHRVVEADEFSNEQFLANPPDRCFHCKDALFGKLTSIAQEQGFSSVFDGSNADDSSDYRPGRKAAAAHGVRSPLAECGLTKEEIRLLSRELGLPTWNRPASPCLSSRIPYGQRIEPADLRRIEAAEEFLRSLALGEVRVRLHGDLARIEVTAEGFRQVLQPQARAAVVEKLQGLGFAFVALDLQGYRTGSMNRVLAAEDTLTL